MKKHVILTLWRTVLTLAFLLAVEPAVYAADNDAIVVFGAASVTDVMQAVADKYQKAGNGTVTFSFAASSALAKQIEASGGADIFISADSDWMNYLDKKGLIQSNSRRDVLGNRLVLIAPVDSPLLLSITPNFALSKALNGGRLALADPQSVPAGKYGEAALTSLGVWGSVSTSIAPAENVRVALTYVARGETPLGIVYETDARTEPRVKVVGVFPESSHAPIVYPFALTNDAKPGAINFLKYAEGPAAAEIYKQAGFTLLSGEK